ncbi:GD13901 [Drosophila simulans]|uniref:GD13901 n=1 Tax=Drosophila simulans TaxID=7240 RepID=B4QIS7_DROSI|nr:GD13901 [Drosophila simulans]
MDSSHIAVRVARRSPSPAAVSQSSYGSLGSSQDIHIRVDKDGVASESTPLLAAAQRSIKTSSSLTASVSASSSTPSSCRRNPTLHDTHIGYQLALGGTAGHVLHCCESLALAAYLLNGDKLHLGDEFTGDF